jgi:hypothetical protein
MFSFLCKNRIPFDPKMREYCIKSTNDSIRKMTEKYNEERKSLKHQIKNLAVITNGDAPNPNPNPNSDIIISIICFLSSTTFFYYFYKASR